MLRAYKDLVRLVRQHGEAISQDLARRAIKSTREVAGHLDAVESAMADREHSRALLNWVGAIVRDNRVPQVTGASCSGRAAAYARELASVFR